jgi:hypothetical protein
MKVSGGDDKFNGIAIGDVKSFWWRIRVLLRDLVQPLINHLVCSVPVFSPPKAKSKKFRVIIHPLTHSPELRPKVAALRVQRARKS